MSVEGASSKYVNFNPLRPFQQLTLMICQCTKERPVCAPCLRTGLPCKYSRKAHRTPLTRDNLTAAESRVKLLETALNTLFPGVDLDTVLLSIQPEASGHSSSKVVSNSQSKLSVPATENYDVDPASESLPLEADGFDWTEKEIELNDVADGMAALSINPEGAGYLGMSCKHNLALSCSNGGRCNLKCGASSSTPP